MSKSVIVSKARTPIGSFLSSLSSLSAPELGAQAIRGAISNIDLNTAAIDQVIMGHVLQGGVGQAPARQASLKAGLPNAVSCTTINKVCGSGLKAIMLANDTISLGDAKTIVAGGMESMSNAPFVLPHARTGFRMGEQKITDLMIHDGLQDPYSQNHMGVFGERCAREYSFSRTEQDSYAHESYQRALNARMKGCFDNEIISITVKSKDGEKVVSEDEELSRFRAEKMNQLKPAFSKDGTITAANASKISDGAAAVVVMDEAVALDYNITPEVNIIAHATVAQSPEWFTTAPILAIREVLKRASLTIGDIDLFEINEAFSVVTMAAIKELGLKHSCVNIFGGAIALGHPIGCSGARIMVTLINALQKQNKRFGCASICLGGGEAVAMIIERR